MQTFNLADGSALEIEEDEWPQSATCFVNSLAGTRSNCAPKKVEQRLTIREHADGRRLVSGTISHGKKLVARSHELLNGSVNPAASLKRIASRLRLAERLVDQCLQKLR